MNERKPNKYQLNDLKSKLLLDKNRNWNVMNHCIRKQYHNLFMIKQQILTNNLNKLRVSWQ